MTVAELTRLSPNVVAFPVGHANAYLWQHGAAATLVDTGAAGSDVLVLDALRRLGLTGRNLVRIVLTHWHHDHTGGAAALAERTGAQVCAGRADAPVIRGLRTGAPPALTAAEEKFMAAIAGQVPPAPASPVHRELDDGDLLTGPGRDDSRAVVLAVPGHTPGSVALHLPAERVLLTGDVAIHHESRVTLGPFNTDRDQARRALRRLAAIDVDAAGFGHGSPITQHATDALATWTDLFA